MKKKLLININKELIAEKISDIEKSISLLDKMASLGEKEFLNDEILVSGVKYQLILAVEAAQSICNHLAARVAREAPCSYVDCFRILGESRIISKDLAAKLVSMAKFRDLLVHQYGKVDDSIVYNIIKNNSKDLIDYINEIRSFLLPAGED